MPLKLLTWIDQSITVYFHIPLLYIVSNVDGLYYASSRQKCMQVVQQSIKHALSVFTSCVFILKRFRIHSMFMYLDLPRRECT